MFRDDGIFKGNVKLETAECPRSENSGITWPHVSRITREMRNNSPPPGESDLISLM